MTIKTVRPNELIEILKADFITRAESLKVHDHSDATQGGQNLHALAEVELNDPIELAIAGGIVTRTQVYHRIDTELGAASDNLDTINGGATGDLLVIRAEDDARTVVVKHGTGNIWLIGAADISLEDTEDHLLLVYDGAMWCSAGDGGGGGALVDHAHSAPGDGGQLDWDDIWSDAVHDHSAAGEGGQLDWDSVWADAVHDHSSAGEGGQDLHALGEVELNDPTELTIAAGAVTRTQAYHSIETEDGDPSDDLDTINGGATGDLLIIRAATHTVVVRHGAGNIFLLGGNNITLDTDNEHLALICDGTHWADFGGYIGLLAHDHSTAGMGGYDLHAIRDLEFNDPTTLNIVAGVVARTQVYHQINPEVGLADTLSIINGGATGDLLIIQPAAGKTITVEHGGGNIFLLGGADIVLDSNDEHLALICDGVNWADIGGYVGLIDHDHSAAGAGGQLDWDDIWSDAVHDHSAAGEGGQDLHAIAEFELNDTTELTIAAGAVTRTQAYHRIDTTGDAPSSDLDTINGGATGDILIIRAENAARTVVVKHGTGNIWLIGAADISLDDVEDHLVLIYDGAKWCSAGDGGGGAGGAHDLLSVTHGDTAAAAVVDGDVIIGNVTPAWSRLAISIPAANVRNVLGIDNGELRPAWKTALDAVAPTTIAAGDVPAAGTSLVFAHRDHLHGSPATWPATDHTHSAAGDGGNLLDLNGGADALVLDADADTSISAPTDDQIDFEAANADQVHISDGLLWPDADDDVDLGDVSHQFKNGYIDGVLYADNVNLEGNADALVLDADGDTSIAADTDDQIDFETGNADRMSLTDAGLAMAAGARIDEFSTDGTLAGNSDTALPTEQAVKEYVDARAPAEHFRAGMRVEYVNAGNIRVGAGVLELNGVILEEQQDSGLVALATAGNWVNGSEAAGMWVYVYALDDGAGGVTIKLSDEVPLYPECDTASLVFYGQIAGEPAANATSIVYDGDTGEANIRIGDILRAWTDSDYGTVRGAWRVTAIDVGINTFTVEANNVDAADNDYLSIVKGKPRYRQYAGVWYRCLGAIRNNGAGNVEQFTIGEDGALIFDDYNNNILLSAGHATTFTAASMAAGAPPTAERVLIILYAHRTASDCYIVVRRTGSGSAGGVGWTRGYTDCVTSCQMRLSPNACLDYLVSNAAADGYIYFIGYIEGL